jgi:predicted Zn-dependent peptidase
MITIKKVLIMMIGVFAFGNIEAQVTMKDPVSFKLKNGIEVVVAENIGMGKVFASVKIEGEDLNTNAAVSEVLTKILTEGASAKGKVVFANSLKEIAPKLSVTADEANVAADAEDFENAFLVMSSALQETVIDQATLDQVNKTTKQSASLAEVKTFYNKQITPSRTYVTIAGNISVAQAKALAKKAFGEWKGNTETSIAR